MKMKDVLIILFENKTKIDKCANKKIEFWWKGSEYFLYRTLTETIKLMHTSFKTRGLGCWREAYKSIDETPFMKVKKISNQNHKINELSLPHEP